MMQPLKHNHPIPEPCMACAEDTFVHVVQQSTLTALNAYMSALFGSSWGDWTELPIPESVIRGVWRELL